DQLVESRAGASIAEIFTSRGEPEFRRLEAEALAEAVQQPPAVIAMGGGAVLSEAAWRLMRLHGGIVALNAPPEELARRLLRSEPTVQQRPLLAGSDPTERLRQLIRERQRFYMRADLSLDTEGLSVDEAAAHVVGMARSLEGALSRRARDRGIAQGSEGSGLAGQEGEE